MPSSQIELYSGVVFDPLDPDPELITLEDIAHALSNQCRFSGHTRTFLSVAEHSINVSYLVPEEDAVEAFMHDASEFALQDMASPLKASPAAEFYREYEARLEAVLAARFGYRYPYPESVKRADKQMLATERAMLLKPPSQATTELWEPWLGDIEVFPDHCWLVKGYSPHIAKTLFLYRAKELGIQ